MRPTRTLLLAAAAGGIALGVAVAVTAGALASRDQATTAPAPPPEPATALATAASADPLRRTPVVEAVERVAPAVVSITTEVAIDNALAFFYGQSTTSSEGSGVVIDPDGTVLTNAHVVLRASRIKASFADGAEYEADLLGISQELDLAVLKLREARGLVAVPIGTSADLMLGEPVIAIGNPFGLGHTVTTGVVSARDRQLETEDRVYQDFIQTDASINPGNSGGPLLDVHGRLIGINTAIRANAENIGFAIPVDRAMKVARDLLQYGSVQIPWLGVDLDDVYVRQQGRRATATRVVKVHDDGAGLALGDVITAVDGRNVQGRGDLNAYLSTFEPPRDVTLTVLRNGSPTTVRTGARRLPDAVVEGSLTAVLGIEVAPWGDAFPGSRGSGAVVTRALPGGAFARRGLRAGDVIVGVNGRSVATPDDLRAAVARAKSSHRGEVLFSIRRGDSFGRVTLPI